MNGLRSRHAFLAGIVGGLALDKVTIVVLLIGIVVGASGAFIIRNGLHLARWVGRKLDSVPYDHRRKQW